MMELVIALSLALIAHGIVGYPVLMAMLARWRGGPPALKPPAALPLSDGGGVSIVICARNEAERIQARLRNLLDTACEGGIEILLYCDGCQDETAARARELGLPGLVVIESSWQTGKPAGLNTCIPRCRFPIVVLADVRQSFEPGSIPALVAAFADPAVAAVSGRLEIAPSASGGGRGVDLYWRLESWLRRSEARYDSVIGCTGAICALRRDLYQPLPEDTLLDDVVIPMRLAAAGWRIAYEPGARALDPQTLAPERERARKLRTLAGNYQMLGRHPAWLLPWRNRLWWQLASHKYLRLLIPWLLILVAALSLAAARGPAIQAMLVVQAALYTAALAGLLLPSARSRLLTVPAGFLQLQWSCLRALFAYLRHRRNPKALWQPVRAEKTAPVSP
jgi:cellulose synthase/poly-beta-1,6-N-acetylglucosamine synthase-like glycosyltransferase